jgi:hypothetical protein
MKQPTQKRRNSPFTSPPHLYYAPPTPKVPRRYLLRAPIIGGLALVAVSLTALLIPAHIDVVNRVAILPELGELATMLWLLIKGVNASTFEPAREST